MPGRRPHRVRSAISSAGRKLSGIKNRLFRSLGRIGPGEKKEKTQSPDDGTPKKKNVYGVEAERVPETDEKRKPPLEPEPA